MAIRRTQRGAERPFRSWVADEADADLRPATGSVLGQEQLLTETAGKMNVPIPSVIEYRCYLSRGYVAEILK